MKAFHKNNLDFIRLIGATLVLVSHAFPLSGHNSSEPFVRITNGQMSFGSLGVLIFFSISGFLITKSYVQRDRLFIFLKARFLRIVPPLIPVVLITIFVLGPLVTSLELKEYFSETETLKYFKNIFPWKVQFTLPGVFESNPNQSPNGSLWTLPFEIKCYLGVAILGVCGLLKRLWFWPFAFFIGSYFMWFWVSKGDDGKIAQMAFVSGAIYYAVWDYIPKAKILAIGCFMMLLLASQFGFLIYGWYLFGTYLVMYLAYCESIKLWRLTKFGDISYGVYIYAFPIQQGIVYLHGGEMSPAQNILYALPLTYLFAYFSWHFIEKKALQLKNYRFF